MAGTNVIVPELVNNYNIYDDKAEKLIGVSGEIDLGELKAMTDTVELAGTLGEYDAPATGHFSSMKLKIPFAIVHGNIFELLDPTEAIHLTLRGSMQTIGQESFNVDSYGVKIVVRGRMTSTALGKWARAKKGEPEVELELLYLKIVIDGKETLELDKLNFKYVINGKDAMAKIRSQI